MTVVLSHATGNANARQALRAFYEHDMLDRFYTSVAWNPASVCNQLLPSSVVSQLRRRVFDQASPNLISTSSARELCRALFERTGPRFLVNGRSAPFSYKRCAIGFDQFVARNVAVSRPSVVYAYATGALETFRAARRLGITTFYEVPTAHWHFMNRLLEEESQREPEFAATIPNIRTEPDWVARQDEELSLADHIVVPCQYVYATLPREISRDTVHVIPYGCPPVPSQGQRRVEREGPLKILFVGNLSQAKGLSYMFRAVEAMGRDVLFTLIGKRIAPCKPVDAALQRYRWIESLPNEDVLREMEHHDVLLFPSLSEGFGLVILEAMSRGMAVVATGNSGAPDVLSHGVNGFIVPIRSTDAIAESLRILCCNRDVLQAISTAASRRAQELGWDRFRTSLADVVDHASKRAGEFASV